MKWLIVEDALRDRKGHWLEYVSTFVRELRALGDEVVVLCDRKAQGFVMEQTGALPVLLESIWHRMGDGAGALKRYLRVPGHAAATFFAMRKVLRGFNHGLHGLTRMGEAQGVAQGTCAGAAFSNPFASKLARYSENTSPTRGASAPAWARIASGGVGSDGGNQLADSGEFLDGQSQAGLQMDSQKLQSIRTANDRSASGEYSSSVPIRDIRGQNSNALDSGHSTLDSSPTLPDWIFVPTVLVHHLLGWWMLLKTGSLPKESRVLLFFPNLPIRLDGEGKPHWTGGPTTKLMAWLFESLWGEVECGKLVLGVETHAMRRALEGLIRMTVVYLPHPVSAKPGQGEARGEGRESIDGAGFPAEAQRRGDFLTTIERQGGREKEQPKVGPKGEGVGTTESNDADEHGWGTTNHTKLHERREAGQGLTGQAGVCESDSLASELADAPVSESLTRSASGPASALCADAGGIGSTVGNQLADSKEVLKGQTQAGLQMDSQKLQSIRMVNDTSVSRGNSSSAPIREIRGSNSESLDAGRLTLDTEASAKPIVFGCYGAARWEKGSDIFQEAIKRILKSAVASAECRVPSVEDKAEPVTRDPLPATAAGRPLRFCIQWVDDFRDEQGNLNSIDPWLLGHPQVEVIGRYFKGDEYEHRLAQTDVMVLPYRKPYQLRVSRVVIEAMIQGMPVIATKGTTLFEQAEEYGAAVGCDEGDAESLAEAILEVAENFEIMRVSAREKVDGAAESFSVSFFRELLEKSGSI